MRRSFFVLALLCTVAAGSWHFARLHGGARNGPEPSLADKHRLEWEHRTEQAWIVDDIVEAILGLGDGRGAGPHGRATVTIQGEAAAPRAAIALESGRQVVVSIEHHIWSPAAYAPIAAAVIDAGGSTSAAVPPVASSPGALEALTTPLPMVIQQENLRISSALQANRRSADAHEDAALLLAALALREAAGDFSDPRRLMSRTTAHLAVARHLRPAPGLAGRVADAALLALAGRERDAAAAIDGLDGSDSPGLRPWLRALRLRTTNDWRPTREERSLTLLEQLETLRAIQATLGSDRALDYLSTVPDPQPTPSWARLMLQWSSSVETGNRLTDDALESELEEARQIAASFGEPDDLSTPTALTAALNVGPARSAVDDRDGRLRVIDAGLWAAASQRHVLMQLQAGYRHLHDRLGHKPLAREFARGAERLAALTMFPLLRPYLASDRGSYESALAGAVELCRRRPDLVPFEVWEHLFQKPSFAEGIAVAIPPSGPWFTPLLPAGTAFDLGNRAFDSTVRPPQPRLSLPEAQRLRALAPFKRQVVMEVVRLRDGNFPPRAIMQREYGELAAYDLILARRIARAAADSPDAYVPLMRHVGALNAESLAELGAYLADRGRDADAQAVYEEWIAKSRDEVEIANGAWWLVRRYHDMQQRRKADALTKRAAAVYSYGGLVTLADLHDWRGEWSAARALYERAASRYDTRNELLAFYLRRVERDPSVQAEIDRLLPDIFPRGFERAALGELTAEPADGVTLLEVGESGRQADLRNHDIIVAVDGIRVHNLNQYRVARGSSAAPVLTLLVWRGGQYVEVSAPLRHSWPVNNLQEYVRGRAFVPTR